MYRKKSHTDQYLNFASHHPLHHKLGVIRTLFDRCDSVVSDPLDKIAERQHIEKALAVCGYPKWSFRKVDRRRSTIRDKPKEDTIGSVVLPYVKGITEECQRVIKSYNISCAAKPVRTLRNFLVHAKDKRSFEENTGVVYKIPCANCDSAYIGETGRNLGTRLSEHRKDSRSEEHRPYTRNQKRASQSVYHSSAVTDHAAQFNHVIDWDGCRILARDSNRSTRWIREAYYIKKQGTLCMNRDIGQYALSNIYNPIIRFKQNDHLRRPPDVPTQDDVTRPSH